MLARSFFAALLLFPSISAAELSPYAGQQARPIKALSTTEVEGLLAGKGMELAKAAELNNYPGPAHVLELASELGITSQHAARLKTIQERMASEAKSLGVAIVDKERALDRLFAERIIQPDELHKATLEIGELRGRLRAVHLLAHLETAAGLTAQQVQRYNLLRGYSQTHQDAGSAPAVHHGKH